MSVGRSVGHTFGFPISGRPKWKVKSKKWKVKGERWKVKSETQKLFAECRLWVKLGRPEIGNPKVWLYLPTDRHTWVGAWDTCVSKNQRHTQSSWNINNTLKTITWECLYLKEGFMQCTQNKYWHESYFQKSSSEKTCGFHASQCVLGCFLTKQ